MKKSISLIALVLLSFSLFSQENGCLQIGMQVFPPSYYGSSYPFVNIMKNANNWQTTNVIYVEGGQNKWNTGFLSQIPLDENGYPLQIPVAVDDPNAEADQIVFTHWSAANTLPAGNYVILYDGEGDVDISGGGVTEIISDVPGRIEYSFDPTKEYADYLQLTIKSSTLGNHVRNIRVLLPGTESTYQTQPWASSWRDKLAPFQTIRFMEFGNINSSTVSKWSDRTPVDYYAYGSNDSHGVPYEWMIQLCNETNSDAWINIPHLADENYIIQLAKLFKNNLNPDLKIYIEYSNEVWNWMFDQTSYLDSIGDQSLPWPERTVGKIGWALKTWTEAFGDAPDRVTRVLASQGAWFDIGDRQFAQMEAEGTAQYVDAISIATYLGVDCSQLDGNSTLDDVFAATRGINYDDDNAYFKSFRKYANLAIEKDKKLLFYEGGQHFTPEPFGTDQPYNHLLVEAQTDARMYDAYVELLDSLSSLTPNEMLFIHHVLVSPKNGKYGSWGSLENQFTQNAPYKDIAPKYQVLLDNLSRCGNSDTTTTDYCSSKGEEAYYEWIESFELNGIQYASGNDWGYGDYTGIKAEVSKGQKVEFALTPGFEFDNYEENVTIWIDYNRDGDFDDEMEKVFVSAQSSSENISGDFVIPFDVPIGETRLRVSMSYEAFPSPCEYFEYGEVEDYTLNILPTNTSFVRTSTHPVEIDMFEMSVYPNPASDYMNIDFTSMTNDDVQLFITDINGKVIKEDKINSETGFNYKRVDLRDMMSGTYFVIAKTSKKTETKMLVIAK